MRYLYKNQKDKLLKINFKKEKPPDLKKRKMKKRV